MIVYMMRVLDGNTYHWLIQGADPDMKPCWSMENAADSLDEYVTANNIKDAKVVLHRNVMSRLQAMEAISNLHFN